MKVQIRPERSQDEQAIYDLTQAAFAPKAYSDGTEGQLISDLRADGDLTLSLVAIEGDQIVGHVAFSPVILSGGGENWFGLGPVAVQIDRQGNGIGSKLINQGLDQLRSQGAAGCALVGDPNYYSRFGFISDGQLTHGGLESRLVQWLSFGDQKASGELKFKPAFGD